MTDAEILHGIAQQTQEVQITIIICLTVIVCVFIYGITRPSK